MCTEAFCTLKGSFKQQWGVKDFGHDGLLCSEISQPLTRLLLFPHPFLMDLDAQNQAHTDGEFPVPALIEGYDLRTVTE